MPSSKINAFMEKAIGKLSEWSKEPHSKCGVRITSYRGFESLTFRKKVQPWTKKIRASLLALIFLSIVMIILARIMITRKSLIFFCSAFVPNPRMRSLYDAVFEGEAHHLDGRFNVW